MAKFKKLLLSQPGLSDLDRLKISYASELVRNESIKTALYGILFFLAGYFPEFLYGWQCPAQFVPLPGEFI